MGKVDQRKHEMLKLLQEEEAMDISSVAERFQISLPTARRMCTDLANDGLAIRTHGGIRKLTFPKEHTNGSEDYYSFDLRQKEFVEEKSRIAEYASNLVQNSQIIFIEAGTTIRLFSIALAERIRQKEITDLVIFTNSLITLNILSPVHDNIMMVGGHYRVSRKDFSGYFSEQALKGLRFNSCFVGADAISLTDGVMAMDIDTVRFDTEVVSHSEKAYVLADSKKFNKSSLISYASGDEITSIITDDGLPNSIAEEYKKHKFNIIIV
jgi:DeoR/GlpR family transcriptional regulator of sugar metabolism